MTNKKKASTTVVDNVANADSIEAFPDAEEGKSFSCSGVTDRKQMETSISEGSSRETEGPCELWTTETFTIDHCGDPNTGNLTFADEGQKFISAFQALSVRNGHAMCNSDSATGDPWDSQQIPGDGVFWKSSEFHRRSGKQGLEERFRLLSPTVIVNCLVGNSGEGIPFTSSVNKKTVLPPYKTDTSIEKNTPRQVTVENPSKQMAYFSLEERSQYENRQKAVNALKTPNRGDKRVRELRKRPAIDYFPKHFSKQANIETQPVKSPEKSLTVLTWYQDEIKALREKIGITGQSMCHNASVESITRYKKRKNSFKEPEFRRSNDIHLRQTKTLLLSLPDSGNGIQNVFSDTVSVTTYINGNIRERKSSMNGNRKRNNDKRNSVDAFNGLFRCNIVEDFQINSLQEELDIHSITFINSYNAPKEHSATDHISICTQEERLKKDNIDLSPTLSSEKLGIVKNGKAVCTEEFIREPVGYFANDSYSLGSSRKSGKNQKRNEFVNDQFEYMQDDFVSSGIDHKQNGVSCVIKDRTKNNQEGGGVEHPKETSFKNRNTKEAHTRPVFSMIPDSNRKTCGKMLGKRVHGGKKKKNMDRNDPHTYIKSIPKGFKSPRGRKRIVWYDARKEDLSCVLTDLGKEDHDIRPDSNFNLHVKASSYDLINTQTEPLNLSMHSASDCREQYYSASANIPLKETSERRKCIIKKRPAKINCDGPTNFSRGAIRVEEIQDEKTVLQSEPVNTMIKKCEKNQLALLNHDMNDHKRVLRSLSPVTYFPKNKKKVSGKSKDKSFHNSEMMECRPSGSASEALSGNYSIDANEGGKEVHIDAVPLEPLDLRVATKINEIYSVDLREKETRFHIFQDTIIDGDEKNSEALKIQKGFSDLSVAISNTEKSKMNYGKDLENLNRDWSICEPDERQRAVDVHTALVGLYAAEKSKNMTPQPVLSGSSQFIYSTEQYASNELGYFQNRSCVDSKEYHSMGKDVVTAGSEKHSDVLLTKTANILERGIQQIGTETESEKVIRKMSLLNSNTIVACKENIEYVAEPLIVETNTAQNLNAILEADIEPNHEIMKEELEKLSGENVSTVDLNKIGYTMEKNNEQFIEANDSRILGPKSASIVDSNNKKKRVAEVPKDVPLVHSRVEERSFSVGTVVWGRYSKSRWWPAVVIDGKLLKQDTRKGREWIFWLSDNKVSELKRHHIELFTSHYKERTSGKLRESMKIGILKALKICAERVEAKLSSIQSVEEWGWSSSGYLKFVEEPDSYNHFPPNKDFPVPSYILEQLNIIRGSKVTGDNRVAALDEARAIDLNDSGIADLETLVKNTGKGRKKVKTKEKDAADIIGEAVSVCLSCDLPLSDNRTMYNHLLFEGMMCQECKDSMMSSYYAIDDDGCSLFCGVCGDGGKQFVCENILCGKSFCHSCIERLSGPKLLKQIQLTNPWYCFLCTDYSIETHGSLIPRKDWQLEVVKFFQADNIPLCDDLLYLRSEGKKKIRVLSLYDGIGTGRLVLNELGLDVGAYFASEINKDAMLVSSQHHTIKHIGSALVLTRTQLLKMCPIDLVIGGPPCNDLSIVNPQRKGFNGTGVHLLKFMLVLKDIEMLCKGNNHVFWLLENTASMVTEFKQAVCAMLGTEPAVWDAKYFTGQRRARNFWGNIPGMYSTPEFCKQLMQEKRTLDAALISQCNRKALVSHMRTITTGTNSLTIRNGEEELPIEMDGVVDGIWIEELEKLFGFPEHYTDASQLSLLTRHRLLGKAWCVPVIKHILSPLTKYFALKES